MSKSSSASPLLLGLDDVHGWLLVDLEREIRRIEEPDVPCAWVAHQQQVNCGDVRCDCSSRPPGLVAASPDGRYSHGLGRCAHGCTFLTGNGACMRSLARRWSRCAANNCPSASSNFAA